MIPSILGIVVILAGLFMVYIGVYGHSKLLPVYPINDVSGTGSAPAQ